MRIACTLALVAALAACSDGVAPLPSDGPPAELMVRFGGFGYGGDVVELRPGGRVVATRHAEFPTARVDSTSVTPDAAAWRRFWADARAARLGAWPRRCVDERIADGAGAEVRVVADGRVVTSVMGNAWPTGDGRCAGPDETAEVRAFFAAVGTLIGRRYPD